MSWNTPAMRSAAVRSSAVIDFATGVLPHEVPHNKHNYYDPRSLNESEKQSIIDYIFNIRKCFRYEGTGSYLNKQWRYVCQNHDISLIELCRYYFNSLGHTDDGMWTNITSDDPYDRYEAQPKVYEHMQVFIEKVRTGVGMETGHDMDNDGEPSDHDDSDDSDDSDDYVGPNGLQAAATPPDVLMLKYHFELPFNSRIIQFQMAILNCRFDIPLAVTGLAGPPGPREAYKHNKRGRGPGRKHEEAHR